MPQLKEIEHTADRAFLVRGKDLNELFTQAAQALLQFEGRKPYGKGSLSREAEVEVDGFDRETLLVNWLNEILFFFDTEGIVFVEFAIDSWTSHEITGRAKGERFDAERHELRTGVKAATYHQFESHAIPGGWELRIFVDV